jgi:hypothetical protein
MDVREPAADFGFPCLGMAGSQPGQAKFTNGRAHAVGELQSPPSWRPPQQSDQHLLGFGTGIGRLGSHHALILTPGRPHVEQRRTRVYTCQNGYKHGAPMELTENEISKSIVKAAWLGHRAYKNRAGFPNPANRAGKSRLAAKKRKRLKS